MLITRQDWEDQRVEQAVSDSLQSLAAPSVEDAVTFAEVEGERFK